MVHVCDVTHTNDLDQFDFILLGLAWMLVEIHDGFADATVAQWIRVDHSELQSRDGQGSCRQIRVPVEGV